MPRAGLSTEAVVTAAIDLVDELGADALSLTRLAERVGVATPSLYKHIDGLTALKQLIAIRLATELTAEFRAATHGQTGDHAIRAICHAYRSFVNKYPSRRLILERAPDPGDRALTEASMQVFGTVFTALADYGISGATAIHTARALRSAIHGFVVLEDAGFGLPEDVNASFEHLITMLIDGLSRHSSRS